MFEARWRSLNNRTWKVWFIQQKRIKDEVLVLTFESLLDVNMEGLNLIKAMESKSELFIVKL